MNSRVSFFSHLPSLHGFIRPAGCSGVCSIRKTLQFPSPSPWEVVEWSRALGKSFGCFSLDRTPLTRAITDPAVHCILYHKKSKRTRLGGVSNCVGVCICRTANGHLVVAQRKKEKKKKEKKKRRQPHLQRITSSLNQVSTMVSPNIV